MGYPIRNENWRLSHTMDICQGLEHGFHCSRDDILETEGSYIHCGDDWMHFVGVEIDCFV
jgi:hypothetical protein